jgi:hypothetical protein
MPPGGYTLDDHPENTPKHEYGRHAELIEQFSQCLPHIPTSEIVEILAVVSVELEVRGADVRGITRTVDKLG